MSRAFLLALGVTTVLLAGCGSIGGPKVEVKVFAPPTTVTPDPSWPQADWQLSVGVQAANELLDSPRIAVRPTPIQFQTYKGALWADKAPELLQTALIEGFEDSQRIGTVTRFGGGSRSDMALVVEVRAFETDYASGSPEAVIEVQARLINVRGNGSVSKRFRRAVPGRAADIESMVDAFGQAMSQLSTDLVGWTLTEGQSLKK